MGSRSNASVARTRLTVLLSSLALMAAVPAFWMSLSISRWEPAGLLVLLLAISVFIGAIEQVFASRAVSFSAFYGAFLVVALLFGPAPAALVALVFELLAGAYNTIDERKNGRPEGVKPYTVSSFLLTASSLVWAALAAGLVFNQLQGTGNVAVSDPTFYASGALAGIVLGSVNYLGVAAFLSLRDDQPFSKRIRSELSSLLHIDTLIIIASIGATVLYTELGILAFSAFAFLAPATAALIGWTVESKRRQVDALAKWRKDSKAEAASWLKERLAEDMRAYEHRDRSRDAVVKVLKGRERLSEAKVEEIEVNAVSMPYRVMRTRKASDVVSYAYWVYEIVGRSEELTQRDKELMRIAIDHIRNALKFDDLLLLDLCRYFGEYIHEHKGKVFNDPDEALDAAYEWALDKYVYEADVTGKVLEPFTGFRGLVAEVLGDSDRVPVPTGVDEIPDELIEMLAEPVAEEIYQVGLKGVKRHARRKALRPASADSSTAAPEAA